MKFSIYVFGPIPTWEGPMRERHGYKDEKGTGIDRYSGKGRLSQQRSCGDRGRKLHCEKCSAGPEDNFCGTEEKKRKSGRTAS